MQTIKCSNRCIIPKCNTIKFICLLAPNTPTAPTYGSRSARSITLRWNAVSGGSLPTTYIVSMNPPLQRGGTISGISGTSITITGLQSNTLYRFKLAASNSYVASQSSDQITIATGKWLNTIFKSKLLHSW